MFSKAGESRFIREIFFPLIERVVDAAFVSTLVLGPMAALAAIAFLANGMLGWAAAALLLALVAIVGIRARFITPRTLRIRRLKIEDQRFKIEDSTSSQSSISNLQSPIFNLQSPISNPQSSIFSLQCSPKIVFFSDLHLGRFKQAAWARRVVTEVNALSPDVILIGGDFVGHPDRHSIPDLLAPLAHLRDQALKLAVFGNHDHGLPGVDRTREIEAILQGFGIRVLKNECVKIADDVCVAGLGELWAGLADVERALAHCPAETRCFVLGHNPDVLLKLVPQVLAARKDRLVWLFGHTHAGQIHIPFAPGLGVPITSHYYRGCFDTPFGLAYVSAGCGEAATPTRLNTQPEIVLVEI